MPPLLLLSWLLLWLHPLLPLLLVTAGKLLSLLPSVLLSPLASSLPTSSTGESTTATSTTAAPTNTTLSRADVAATATTAPVLASLLVLACRGVATTNFTLPYSALVCARSLPPLLPSLSASAVPAAVVCFKSR